VSGRIGAVALTIALASALPVRAQHHAGHASHASPIAGEGAPVTDGVARPASTGAWMQSKRAAAPASASPAEHAAHAHGTQHLDAPVGAAASPPQGQTSPSLPVITDADRAAAFPVVHAGHASHDRMSHGTWLVDRLEAHEGTHAGAWETSAWIGGDVDRVWLRSEGDIEHGRVERANVEVLAGHATSPWWDVLAGVRTDIGQGKPTHYAAIGIQGLAPYKVEVRATAYVGAGRSAARLEGEYETLLTNRWIVQWRSEVDLYGGRADPARGLGTGLSTVNVGGRLRYEVTRRFAPYVGLIRDTCKNAPRFPGFRSGSVPYAI